MGSAAEKIQQRDGNCEDGGPEKALRAAKFVLIVLQIFRGPET
jgi:hypothetical protein